MIGWLAATLTGSAWSRAALRYSATALAILLFLLALRRSGERAGRLAEQFETMERIHATTDARGGGATPQSVGHVGAAEGVCRKYAQFIENTQD